MTKKVKDAEAAGAVEAPAPGKPADSAVYYTKDKQGYLKEVPAGTEGAISIDWTDNPPVDDVANRLGISPQAVARVRPE